jgi:putative hydrolase of the HAD superfamily
MIGLPKAVLFDLDGTIIDWQTGMDEHWLDACTAACGDDSRFEAPALHAAITERRTWFWADEQRAAAGRMDLEAASARIVEYALTDLGHDLPDLASTIALDYRARRHNALAPYPGAIQTLEALRDAGVRMALITNGSAVAQRRSIERFDLARYFDCVVIEGEFGSGKPDERNFLHALSTVSCAACDAWMVGDSLEADIAPAVTLGMHAVWVASSRFEPPDVVIRPHRTIDTIAELLT